MSQLLTFESFLYVENPNHVHGDKRLEAENKVAEEIATAIKGILDHHGFVLKGGETLARYARAEEVIKVTPRKLHFEDGEGVHICATPFVSKKNLTHKTEKVTCKLCLKELAKRTSCDPSYEAQFEEQKGD